MLKQYAKYHYGIKKHTNGDSYENDCWVLDDNYKPIKYIYKASANYMCEQLNKAHSGRMKFYVAWYEEGADDFCSYGERKEKTE